MPLLDLNKTPELPIPRRQMIFSFTANDPLPSEIADAHSQSSAALNQFKTASSSMGVLMDACRVYHPSTLTDAIRFVGGIAVMLVILYHVKVRLVYFPPSPKIGDFKIFLIC